MSPSQRGIWPFFPFYNNAFRTVLENELFISVFSSELGVGVITLAGYQDGINSECADVGLHGAEVRLKS